MSGTRFFRYRRGNTFLHKMPASPKLLLMLLFAVLAFFLPSYAALCAWLALIIFSLVFLKFRLNEVLTDLAPAAAYALMLILLTVVLNAIRFFQGDFDPDESGSFFVQAALFFLTPEPSYIRLFSRLALSIQISSILYRTTSISQFSEGFRGIESFFTRKDDARLSEMLTLTLTFIPRLVEFWERISLAWESRGGTKNARRIRTLVPALFKTGMTEAYTKALARENRR